jgi:hypothetical protein
MNCHEFETRLERLLDDALEPGEKTDCLRHAEQCPICGEMLEAVGGLGSGSPAEEEEPLVESILQRTIGSVCTQAEEKLPAYVDHELGAEDRQLLQGHLNSCESCRKLVTTLGMMSAELPRLAEVSVGEDFTHRVLARTLPTRIRLQRWIRQNGSSWVQRPRFAMEAAYAALLIVMLVLGAFSTPVAALPKKGLDLMQPDPSTPSVWTQTADSLGTFWEWVASLLEKAEETPESTEETP